MNNKFFHIEYLSPTGFIGFWILFIVLIFTGIILSFLELIQMMIHTIIEKEKVLKKRSKKKE